MKTRISKVNKTEYYRKRYNENLYTSNDVLYIDRILNKKKNFWSVYRISSILTLSFAFPLKQTQG